MFRVEDRVEIVSDGRIGTIKNINWHSDAVNMPGATAVVDNYLVRFGNDITKEELFTPEQLRPAK